MKFGALRDNRRLAPPPEAAWPSLRSALGLLLLVTAVAVFYAYTSVKTLEASYQLSQGLEYRQELLEVGRSLRVELNNLKSPERLERASLRLGLSQPAAIQIRGLK